MLYSKYDKETSAQVARFIIYVGKIYEAQIVVRI